MAAAPGAAGAAAAAAVAPPNPLIKVRAVLDVCGFKQAVRDRFITAHGISELRDFDFIPFDQARDAIKMYNDGQTRQGVRMGYLDQMKFKAFLWWYHDQRRMQRVPRAAQFDDDAMRDALQGMQAEAELARADKVEVKVPKLDTEVGWFDWLE